MKMVHSGRFCDNCQKNVIDFTNQSREQILEYLLKNYNKSTCGKINRSQLDFSSADFLITIGALSKQKGNGNLAFYLVSMAALVLASCNNSTPPYVKNTETTTIQRDTFTTSCTPPVSIKGPIGKDNNPEIQVPGEIPVLGDIALIDSFDHVEPFTFAEKMPEFIGGVDSLYSFIRQNLVYPQWEKDNKIEGRVIVTFVIDAQGKVTSPEIIKGIAGGKNLDQEVLRVIGIMPDWIPGELHGKKVAIKFTMPFVFKL